MKTCDVFVALFLIIGGMNWGLVGLFECNLIEFLFGGLIVDRVIYVLVGASALYQAFAWKDIQKRWR